MTHVLFKDNRNFVGNILFFRFDYEPIFSHLTFTAFLYICLLYFFSLYINRTDGTESPILADPEAEGRSDKPKLKYGELVILG